MDSREPAIVIPVIVVGMALASLGIFGVQAAWGVEMFGVKHRYTKMAVAKELGSILSGGTAPLVAAALLSFTGHWWPIAVYSRPWRPSVSSPPLWHRKRADAI